MPPETEQEFSMEKLKMSYDTLDFTRPNTGELRPHYHSSSTLKSVKSAKSKELLVANPTPNEIMGGSSGYVQATMLEDTNILRKLSSGHLSQGEIPQVRPFLKGEMPPITFYE